MEPILRLDGVSKGFGGVVAADHVSLAVMPGQVHGLIGPNGAGKSTLMNIISGIYTPDSGSIYFDGRNIDKVPAHTRARMGIGRTFQVPRFLQRSSIRDNLLMGTDVANHMGYVRSFLGKKGLDFQEELQELVDIAGISIHWDEPVTAIPFGERKLLEIVRSLLAHPRVLLVDEPAAGLNQREIENAVNLLNHAAREKHIGILLIEHSMDMIMDICEWIIVINFGKELITGTPQQVVADKSVIEAYLGRDFHAEH